MDAAWPAARRRDEPAGGFFARRGGVTQRANSVWPRRSRSRPARRPPLLRAARPGTATAGCRVIFQVFDDDRRSALNAVLDEEGFTRQSETLILVRRAGRRGRAGPARPASKSRSSLRRNGCGCGGALTAAAAPRNLATARGILDGCPVAVRPGEGRRRRARRRRTPRVPPGGADSRGGLYCMATRPDARRRGYATRCCRRCCGRAAQGLDGYWLLVTGVQRRCPGTVCPGRLPRSRPLSLPAGTAEAAPDRLLSCAVAPIALAHSFGGGVPSEPGLGSSGQRSRSAAQQLSQLPSGSSRATGCRGSPLRQLLPVHGRIPATWTRPVVREGGLAAGEHEHGISLMGQVIQESRMAGRASFCSSSCSASMSRRRAVPSRYGAPSSSIGVLNVSRE